MKNKIITFSKMLNTGLASIQLNYKQDYRKYVPKNATELSQKNWEAIGNRLRSAIHGVTK